jgi:transcriptional regulator GlxA family with amidase domain
MGERTLLHRFQQATGLKPSEYFRNVRVSRAQEALEYSTDTVEEITTMVGYRDYTAFRRYSRKLLD